MKPDHRRCPSRGPWRTCGCRESRPWLWPGGLRSWPVSRDDHRSWACGSCSFWSRGSPRGCGCRGREEAWKEAEILILRHQLAVLRRQQPGRVKLNWADRAFLAALLGAIPRSRRLRLLVSPDTMLRWHRDIVRRRWAARSARQDRPAIDPPEHQGPSPSAGPREPRLGIPQDPRQSGLPLGVKVAASTVWEILRTSGLRPDRRLNGPTWSSCAPRLTRSWHAISSRPTCSTAPRPTSWPPSSTPPGASASSGSPCALPGNGPPSRPAT